MKIGKLSAFQVFLSLLLKIVALPIEVSARRLKLLNNIQLDIIHTQTEFSLGLLGIWIARELKIPVIHTYHTQYEDYVHYIAKGMLIRPSMVKYLVRGFLHDVDGVICPSEIVRDLLSDYKVKVEKRVIPTGIELAKFERPEIKQENLEELRSKLGIQDDEKMLLSLSRISYEKNIQAVLAAFAEVLKEEDKVKLVVAGDGPYLDDLKEQAKKLEIQDYVIFTGMIAPSETALYYKAADFFISASTSETQGLTYLESFSQWNACHSLMEILIWTILSVIKCLEPCTMGNMIWPELFWKP